MTLTATSGVYIVAQTPLEDGGEVDLESVDTLVEFYTSGTVQTALLCSELREMPASSRCKRATRLFAASSVAPRASL